MIYTITVNPALDYVMQLDQLTLGEVNRTDNAQFLAGGKGINVSQILNQLELPNTALGFVGGFTGQELIRQIEQKHIIHDFVEVSGETRVNVKIHAETETEINGAGPKISTAEIERFKSRLQDLQAGDVVVMSGSLAPSLPTDFYGQLIKIIRAHDADFVVDTTGQALLDTLADHPLVIKPNHHELADLFQTTFKDDQDMLDHAKKLLNKGAQMVMISMAGAGGYLVTPKHVYHANAAKGTAINSVGAGDSMIAGFVGTYNKTKDPVLAFEVGMSCGAATAFTEDIATKAQIGAVRPQIKVEQVD